MHPHNDESEPNIDEDGKENKNDKFWGESDYKEEEMEPEVQEVKGAVKNDTGK